MTKDEILKARRNKMTDEEKAEEYVNNNGFGSDYNDIESYDANEEIRQAYLDGLAEGRKEKEEAERKAWVGDRGDFMESLESFLREGESHDSIKMGKCGNCGKEYVLITGSNFTASRNLKRFAEVGNPAQHGWCAFRCRGCKEVIENTWVETTTPKI